MRTDRYTKLVLTAIALGLWLIAVPRVQTQEVMAAPTPVATTLAPSPPVGGGAVESPSSAVGPRAPATLPLRWRVGFAGHKNLDLDAYNDCSTVISVMSTAPTSMNVEVEFFGQNDAFINDGTATLAAGAVEVFATVGGSGGGSGPSGGPVSADTLVNTGNFDSGFARVHADDPRLLVTAFLTCNQDQSAGSILRALLNIPAFPVGATAEYFQAGMPAEMEALPVVDPIP